MEVQLYVYDLSQVGLRLLLARNQLANGLTSRVLPDKYVLTALLR